MAFNRSRMRGIKEGYRSGLEEDTAAFLDKHGVPYTYEQKKIKWVDLKYRTYTPDFVLANGIIIETKGRFLTDDRRKHKEIKKQYPQLDIRFVFTNCKTRLYKGSNTTYADWCDKNGFKYANKEIPQEWLQEKQSDQESD